MHRELIIKTDEIIVKTGDAEFHPNTVNVNGICYLKSSPKKKPSLFTTFDGVDMSHGMDYWAVTSDFKKILHYVTVPFHWWHHPDDKTFSTKEAAEHYVTINKVTLSVNDVIDVCAKIMFHNREIDRKEEDYNAVYVTLLRERLVQLSKEKNQNNENN